MELRSLYSAVIASDSVLIGEHCTIGVPKEARVLAERQQPGAAGSGSPVTIDDRCLLCNNVILYEGVRIARDCILEDRVRVGYDSTIGERSRIAYGAYVCDRVNIGS